MSDKQTCARCGLAGKLVYVGLGTVPEHRRATDCIAALRAEVERKNVTITEQTNIAARAQVRAEKAEAQAKALAGALRDLADDESDLVDGSDPRWQRARAALAAPDAGVGGDAPSAETRLRKLLWLRHDQAHFGIIYGDDGEMQCAACFLDFKRDSAERIEARFHEQGLQKLAAAQAAEPAAPRPSEQDAGALGFCDAIDGDAPHAYEPAECTNWKPSPPHAKPRDPARGEEGR